MSVHEEIREQQKKLKGQGFKAHLEYFWDYYKIHTIIAVAAIILITVLVKDIVTSKPYGFYAIMLNAGPTIDEDFVEEEFAQYTSFDTVNYDCFIDTSGTYNLQRLDDITIATNQKIMANIAAGELDIIVADSDIFSYYANQSSLMDLREILTAEQLDKYSDNFVYVDQKYLDYLASDEYNNYINTGEFDETNKYAVIADAYNKDFTMPSTSPDNMDTPIPVGINISDSPVLETYGAYNGTTPMIGILINTKRPELALQFIEYLAK